ncbi:MAG: exodeoxyribonuclease VII small subunit [Muribaculum sp.]|nr:exodeoxyribonuclease VII small subunit [Muribaculum sp.]
MAGKKRTEDAAEATLEENFARLEETIGRLEDEEISLEEAFAAYSEGMKLLQTCNGQIDRVEKQVMKLAEDGGMEELES